MAYAPPTADTLKMRFPAFTAVPDASVDYWLTDARLRYLITILGTFAVARGWVEADNVEGIVTAAVTVGTVLYGLYRTHRQKSQLVVTADAAPNSVAVVKA